MRETNHYDGTRGDREGRDENSKICLSLGGVILALFLRLPLHQFKETSKDS